MYKTCDNTKGAAIFTKTLKKEEIMNLEKAAMAILSTIILVTLLMIGWIAPAFPATQSMKITMPDGSTVPLDGLDTHEIRQMSELAEKVAKNKAQAAAAASENASWVATDMIANPEKLDIWRKLITGTIKDVCTDLNVTVNDFIKTPVGTITAALIIYKVAGKELLERIFRVVFITSFWSIMMGILFYLRKKYFSVITIYEKKKEIYDEVAKKFTTRFTVPKLVTSYPWYSKNINGHSESRTVFAVILVITGLVTTITSVVVALT